jgi:hypothetical protein
VSVRTERVDVLFLDGVDGALPPAGRLRAQFVIQRVPEPINLRRAVARAEELMEAFQAHGAALVGANNQPSVFLKELARHLSHDEVIHAAVWNANGGGSPPVIVGRSDALDRMSIAGIADSYSVRGRASLLAPSRPRFYFLPIDGQLRNTVETPMFIDGETKGLGEAMRTRAFDSEIGFGVPAIDDLTGANRGHLVEVEFQARRVQMAVVNAFEPGSSRLNPREVEIEINGRFLADAINLVRVRISAESLQASADVAFPSNALDANGQALVEIRFEVSNAAVAFAGDREVGSIDPAHLFSRVERDSDLPQVAATATLFLPRTGPSTDAYFLVRTRSRAGEVLKGTLLLSVNRRPQQAIDLSISVSDRISPPHGESPSIPALKLEVRALPFVEFVDAAERREFDLGLFVNDDSDGSGRRIIAIDRGTQGLPLDKLRDAIATISEHIGTIAYRNQVEVAWGDALVVESLRVIADQGHLMRVEMERFWPSKLDAPERIAIAGPWDQYVPIEYVYEGPAPDFDAEVCPNALARMEKGKCGKCGDCPHRQTGTYVCPLRFWGFSSEIERRYADTLEQARPGQGPGRRRLGRLTSSMLGYSDRSANFDGADVKVKELTSKLSDVVSKIIPATDWIEWCRGIAGQAPNLLLLMPHTGTYQSRDALELGTGTTKDHWRAKSRISEADVGLTDQVEFVALLGCNTTESNQQFATYPEQFRRYGADLLLTTTATVRGADAVPIATVLVDMLKEAASSPRHLKTFGGFVTELRRRAFVAGAPGVLSVVAYGDADWIVGDADV